jgi:hypothetical protein
MDNSGKLTGSPTAQLQAFAQSVYKMIKNRYYDDLTSADGQVFLQEVVDWANEFIDELEFEINSDGDPIDWIWVRQLGVTLGTASTGADSISFDTTTYNNLITSTERFVQILSPIDGVTPIANFTVVAPNDQSNDSRRNTFDSCTVVGGVIEFSRPFTTTENNGVIIGDATTYLPRIQFTLNSTTGQIQATNVAAFSTIRPLTLLKLGTVKNAILPDIVMGNLWPNYVSKYNDLLTNAINRSEASAVAPTADYDDFSVVHGVGF